MQKSDRLVVLKSIIMANYCSDLGLVDGTTAHDKGQRNWTLPEVLNFTTLIERALFFFFILQSFLLALKR